MRYTNLDSIVRRVLISARLPLHYYMQALNEAAICLRELHLDTLQVVNTVRLDVNTYFAADLPCDFVDAVTVGVQAGNRIRPIARMPTLNPLNNFSSTGAKIPYRPESEEAGNVSYWGGWSGWYWLWNVNDLGEPLGRGFGANTASQVGYIIIPERNQIQFTENICSPTDTWVLQYISDGQSSSACTQVDIRASKAIESYIIWKMSTNANNKDAPEGRQFMLDWKHLRSRLNPIDAQTIRNILHANYRASIKN